MGCLNQSLNPILTHICSKKNDVVDMLSRARFNCEEDMETQEIGEDDDDEIYNCVHATDGVSSSGEDQCFRGDLYVGKLRDIDVYLNTMRRQEHWSNKTFKYIRHRSYKYFLREFIVKETKEEGRSAIENGR